MSHKGQNEIGRTTPECRVEFDKVWVRFFFLYLTAYTVVR